MGFGVQVETFFLFLLGFGIGFEIRNLPFVLSLKKREKGEDIHIYIHITKPKPQTGKTHTQQLLKFHLFRSASYRGREILIPLYPSLSPRPPATSTNPVWAAHNVERGGS
jgi:hypothetical protein